MENLQIKSNVVITEQSMNIIRPLAKSIDWNDRLIAVLGARGTGKTTLLLQRLKAEYGTSKEALYITMDDIYFTGHLLSDLAMEFRQQGGKILFIDEVHKYPNWAREIKNIYDFYKDIKIVFTGSSIIDINRQNADLSRRAVQYEMTGLSYREYLQFIGVGEFDAFRLEDILEHHVEIANSLSLKFKPLQYFNEYLRHGYYPFFIENINTYAIRVERVVRLIIEEDLQFVAGFNPHHSRKIYQLMSILATNVPFKPNITKLSEKTGIHRNMIVEYLYYLNNARLINSLAANGKSISILQKPDKIFLENTNLLFALAPENVDTGSLRESFFMNQFSNTEHNISLPLKGDFLIDDIYTFEVGGTGKTNKQIEGINKAYLALDNLESGINNKIPLWLFGFLY
ncbi:ATP-binding protein [Pedobacter sp. HDW13]|uniref:ATP-binding protein n=1 Tax=unclassified Pedobacter TaxID=2628915 RepID=UPI000F5A9ED1|nr:MULTISPECIES: AAA family ATPase [unclassified Pedobacter]QIL40701.1 ATP-binding protein [Pedobacter sp. HDW13]RQO71487.1 AAA family ATPase [Pedobacter sp. KBW01]